MSARRSSPSWNRRVWRVDRYRRCAPGRPSWRWTNSRPALPWLQQWLSAFAVLGVFRLDATQVPNAGTTHHVSTQADKLHSFAANWGADHLYIFRMFDSSCLFHAADTSFTNDI